MILQTEFSDLGTPRKGKVRDIYDLGDQLLFVATDRVSAFDVVLPTGIPDKGRVLTQLSLYWFRTMEPFMKNHVIESDVEKFPSKLAKYADQLRGRSMLVTKAKVVPAECVVRGYLAGSGWKDYKETGSICGIPILKGLGESAKLAQPIFTPTTKADVGHDMNVSFDELKGLVGASLAEMLREKSIGLYQRASEIAEKRGIIMDYLNTLDWNKTYPGPDLPADIVEKTRARYLEIYRILTGKELG
ncbi:MAG: phosphoribosylaminoimidazole-succinocarboxamide synthase [Deltaproteobacteria bacterium]|nr:phosphoribosylaminoimidazole-succinocarboxamide synthase [Deltaproteobacteria bacterium]